MSNATAIATARVALAAALVARAELDAALEVTHPEPVDGPDEVWEAWNDAYEDAREARGGLEIDDDVRAAEDEVLRATRAAMLAYAPGHALISFDAALGENGRLYNPTVRRRVLALCDRLDLATV